MRFNISLYFLLFSALPTGANAVEERIRCTSKTGPDAVISMSAHRVLGRVANCLNADFMGDGSRCAPDGTYVVSYPTGAAGPQRIVTRWQDYMNDHGPVIQNVVTDNRIHFHGGFVADTFSQQWSFDVDRITGQAIFEAPKGERFEGRHLYACSKVSPRF